MTGPAAQALVLDCDGVLADTERYGHLVAFNQTFAEFGLPVRWSVAGTSAILLAAYLGLVGRGASAAPAGKP